MKFLFKSYKLQSLKKLIKNKKVLCLVSVDPLTPLVFTKFQLFFFKFFKPDTKQLKHVLKKSIFKRFINLLNGNVLFVYNNLFFSNSFYNISAIKRLNLNLIFLKIKRNIYSIHQIKRIQGVTFFINIHHFKNILTLSLNKFFYFYFFNLKK